MMACVWFIFLSVAIFGASVEGDTIAFTAGQDTHLDTTNTSTTVPFTKVITNTTAALDNGVFTCKEAGIYKFQVYSLSRKSSAVFFELYHNSQLTVSLWSRTSIGNANDYADAGNAAILSLNVGDTVEVKSRDGYYVSAYGTSGEIYTTFTGIQLGTLQLGINPVTTFSVALNTHQDVVGGTAVLYNTVILDTDNAYDVTTGTFTAPSAGIYEFQFFSLARQDETLWQDLYHNGDYVCSLYGKTTQEYADAGNTAILHLKQGDQVQVRAHAGTQNNIYGASDQIYSTFSGHEIVLDQDMNDPEDHVVYFSAGLTGSRTYNDGERVVFDLPFSDHSATSDHYDHTTGEFTAPYPGLYEFTFHALSQQSQPIWLDLYRGYRYIDSLYSHVPDGYAAAGNTAVIELDAKDLVYVRAHNTNALYGTAQQVYCTFSGVLIQPAWGLVDVVGK